MLGKLELSEFFDAVIDDTRITRGKPDPEVYLTAVRNLAVREDECVAFEDSRAGMTAAVSAGLATIGVATTHDGKELLSLGARRVVRDRTGLTPAVLEDILRS